MSSLPDLFFTLVECTRSWEKVGRGGEQGGGEKIVRKDCGRKKEEIERKGGRQGIGGKHQERVS